MISKNRISQIRKLHAKKFRDESGLFLVEGYKSVEMLCASDFEVEEIFATENALTDNAAWLSSLSPTLVTAEEMSRISTMQTAPELLAVARQRQHLPDIPADQGTDYAGPESGEKIVGCYDSEPYACTQSYHGREIQHNGRNATLGSRIVLRKR